MQCLKLAHTVPCRYDLVLWNDGVPRLEALLLERPGARIEEGETLRG